MPPEIDEHRRHPGCCPCCARSTTAGCRSDRRGGLVGPRLTTLIAYLKAVCHASFSTVRKFLRDVIGLTISRGQLRKVIAKVSRARHSPTRSCSATARAGGLNVDETWHKQGGNDAGRGASATGCSPCLGSTRPEWGCADRGAGGGVRGGVGLRLFLRLPPLHREFGVVFQFCLAHLIRDVKYLTTLPDPGTGLRGGSARGAAGPLRGDPPAGECRRRDSEAAGGGAGRGDAQATWEVPATRAATNLAARMEAYGESYFRFIAAPGVEPTNNPAEQAIRFVVIDRQITQGTRGEGRAGVSGSGRRSRRALSRGGRCWSIWGRR